MDVSLEVVDSCAVSAAPLRFTMDKNATSSAAQSSIDLECTPNTEFDVAIDRGMHAMGATRRMLNAETGVYAPYEIYLDSGHTTPWGGLGANTVHGESGTTGSTRLTAFAKVQNNPGALAAGSYADTVIVSVHF